MANNRLLVRLLDDNIRDPFKHFAVEEALLRLLDEQKSPMTLRIRRFEPSVWIGVNQFPEEDVDIAACEKLGLKIIRRPNPGGAVYQDDGSFCFSFFFNTEQIFKHLKITEPSALYDLFGKAVIETCAFFGVTAKISGRNDVTINNRKIYGSAQLEFYDSFVHSGTFLVYTNISLMSKVLKPSDLKFADKGFTNVRERVITLNEAAEKECKIDKVIEVLIERIAQNFNLQISTKENSLTKIESELVEDLYSTKYSKRAWTFRDKPARSFEFTKKTSSGILTLLLHINNNIIENFSLTGDFLFPNQKILQDLERTIIGKTILEAKNELIKSQISADLKEILIEIISEVEINNVSR